MPSIYQILLFATCVFLYFIPGGLGAPPATTTSQPQMLCRMCSILHPGDLCFPSISCSMSSKQTCHALNIYFNGELQQKVLSCKHKAAAKCGSVDEFPEKGIRFENQCCENKDFCNENL
ncbi:sperm acrosomal protein FSA-ACR.1-like [Erythrolamprus reginae]|uniref:sperm acrosomal protein FSA-ACR.1-like n=1 Tax=Erythrolamprus reginae TaxID=121349 RepID=UPI00396CD020